MGLNINENKTEYMCYNSPEDTTLTVNKNKIKCVINFQYLGSWLSNSEQDIKMRKGKAWTATWKLDNIWKADLP